MSSNTPKREWRLYVDDMILFAEKVQRYTQNLDQVTFINSVPYYYDVFVGKNFLVN